MANTDFIKGVAIGMMRVWKYVRKVGREIIMSATQPSVVGGPDGALAKVLDAESGPGDLERLLREPTASWLSLVSGTHLNQFPNWRLLGTLGPVQLAACAPLTGAWQKRVFDPTGLL